MEKIINKTGNPIVVYTALFGNYDTLIDPRKAYEGCDFVCFTDQDNIQTEIWKPVIVDKPFQSPVAANRHFKWLPHLYLQEYGISLYLDSNIILYTDPKMLAEKYLSQTHVALPKHPFRHCLYEEAITCIQGNTLTLKQVYKQITAYKRLGYPANNSLPEQNIILRRHNQQRVIKIMNNVWSELERWGNYRDQLAFSYITWNLGEEICLMDENARNNKEFIYILHRKNNIGLLEKAYVALRLQKRRFIDVQLLKVSLKYLAKPVLRYTTDENSAEY